VVYVIAPVINVVACSKYAARVRTRAAARLVWGAAGALAVSVVSQAFTLFVLPLFAGGFETFSLATRWAGGLGNVLGLAFALLFSVSLFQVLRDADRTGSTAAAPVEASPEGVRP
jgi:hypothetical protein